MRKYILLTFIILVLILFQESFLFEFLGYSLNINFVIILAFSFVLTQSQDYGLYTFFIGGLTLDLIGNSIIGLSSFIFIVYFFVTDLLFRTVAKNIYVQIFLIMFLTYIYKIVNNSFNITFSFNLLFSGFINAIFALVISYFMKKASKKYL